MDLGKGPQSVADCMLHRVFLRARLGGLSVGSTALTSNPAYVASATHATPAVVEAVGFFDRVLGVSDSVEEAKSEPTHPTEVVMADTAEETMIHVTAVAGNAVTEKESSAKETPEAETKGTNDDNSSTTTETGKKAPDPKYVSLAKQAEEMIPGLATARRELETTLHLPAETWAEFTK